VKRPYLFGYLFARAAKGLALFVTLIGIGYCFLQYSEANAAASAVAYQPSASLQRALGNLRNAFVASERIVSAFNVNNRVTTPKVQEPHFPVTISINADFVAVAHTLARADQDRRLLKQSVVSRFDALVRSIETKLRAYAAGLGSLPSPSPSPSPAASSSAGATPVSVSLPTQEEESLFSSRLNAAEVDKRNANLGLRKEFLKVLETKAENPENRSSLNEAVDQLKILQRLLPEELESSAAAPSEPPSAEVNLGTEKSSKILPSERIASQLAQLRGEVRQTFLSPWTLDDAFEQASDLAAVEREKCRVADLAQKGIWLSSVSRILIGLLAAALASLVILVCADLVKTFLDTASHTGVVADAINAMRGATVIAKNQYRETQSNGGQ
jgi:hypothetical protein